MSANLLVWDIGGVLLSNGWDHAERAQTAEHFGLDLDELNRRVDEHAIAYELGETTLAEFLHATVFYAPREFTLDECARYVFGLSRPHEEVLSFARAIARQFGPMVALNNEGAEFNQNRIDTFRLTEILRVFFSSCYTRIRKPDPRAFRLVTQAMHVDPSRCVFIDDRTENVAAAENMGWTAFLFRDLNQLRSDLAKLGISAP